MALKIGFLGGGQLARMMALEAHRLGFEPHVYSASQEDPAAQVTAFHHPGKLQDFNKLQAFAQSMDHLTFESEFVPPEILLELEKNQNHKIYPKPLIMRKLQNRLSQKQTLEAFKIPTSPFIEIQEAHDLLAAWNTFQNGFVLKTLFGGYDGYGTFFAKSASDLKSLEKKLQSDSESYLAEKLISFRREVACVLVRNSLGQCQALPLVETYQTQGKCDWVRGPIQHKKWPNLQKRLFHMMKSLDYIGVLAVEMFDTGAELWVNELAPRVHNSAHYSQNALLESQFALHLKAGLGLPLIPSAPLSPQFVMVNLIGQSHQALEVGESLTGALHLYGKKENRPGRKMGHINYLGGKGPALLKKAQKERKRFHL